jgi:signal transduction histidine kinase/ActR/RegA family two-component response regulator
LANSVLCQRFRAAAAACGFLAVAIGMTALLGWVLGSEFLQGRAFAGITMKTNASVCVISIGIIVVLLSLEARGEQPLTGRGARILAGLVLAIGVVTLAEHLFDVNIGIDELLFREQEGAVATQSPNRMGPPASLCFSLLALARLLVGVQRRGQRAPFQYLAIAVALVSSVPLLGYLFDARALYSVGKYTGIALPTAAALWLLAVGLLVSTPEVGLMRRLVAEDSGALLLRRLLPAAIGVPALLMLLRLWGEDLGLYDQALGRALLVIAFSVVFAAVVWRTGDVVFSQELNATRAERSLHEQTVKSLAALADADRRKTEFLAVLAHELRNPLAPVRNAVHLLRARAAVDTEAVRPYTLIERQIEHLSRLIDDLMDVSRISRDSLELRKEQVVLSEIAATALEATRHLLDAKGHSITVQLPEYDVQLEADAARLVQVFTNLLANAAHYTPPGGEITLSTGVEPPPELPAEQRQLVVSVRDNGMGIAPEQLPRVFDLFYQIGGESRQGGLGIGLALVRKLVELHGGSVRAVSAGRGQGSTFTVYLPGAVLVAALASPQRTARPELPSLPRLSVLVVEDNLDSAEMLGELLQLAGADVKLAHDGESALVLGAQFQPQVILLDIGLPGISGYDVARQVRSSSWAERTRIVALTGWGSSDDRARSKGAGIDHHLVKPVKPDALLALLAELRGGVEPHGPASGAKRQGLESM